MSSETPPGEQREQHESKPSNGPNLVLIYGLLGAALLIAMGLAMLIVLPFYHQRH